MKKQKYAKNNPDFFGIFKSKKPSNLIDGFYIMFSRDLGALVIYKQNSYIFAYSGKSKRFKFYLELPDQTLEHEIKVGSLVIIPITDIKFLELLNTALVMSQKQ